MGLRGEAVGPCLRPCPPHCLVASTDADWCVNRGNVALTHGKYHVAETLYHEAYALDPSIDLDALLNNLGSTRRIHKSGIKEDILDTPLSEEQLKARFRQLDVDNNGFLYKQVCICGPGTAGGH